jgi:Arc/MetJ family transcription regulator
VARVCQALRDLLGEPARRERLGGRARRGRR